MSTSKQYYHLLFDKLNLIEKIEYFLLFLFTFILAVSWYRSVFIMYFLPIIMITKIITARRIGNNSLSPRKKLLIFSLLCFYGIYVVSFLWSNNMFFGWCELTKKRALLIFPILFLLSDYSYLSKQHINALLTTFVLGTIVRFFYRLTISLSSIVTNGGSLSGLINSSFDCMHHTFLAMFTIFSLFLVFRYLFNHKINKLKTYLLWVCIIILTSYTLFIQSRIGIINLYLSIIGCILLLFFKRRSMDHFVAKKIVIGIILCISTTITLTLIQKDDSHRIASNIQEVSSGDYSDIRYDIWMNALITIKDNFPWGCGIGDYPDAMVSHYPYTEPNSKLTKDSIMHPHNQFLATLLSTGVVGLLILLIIFFCPLFFFLTHKENINSLMIPFLLIIGTTSLVDSTLDWPIGTLFLGYFYCLILSYPTKYIYTNI